MIKIDQIFKSFGKEPVLQDLNLHLSDHITLSILGKSGCGKSTLLKIMAGLEFADQGSFIVEQQDMFALSPQKRGVVYLSQEPLLFPHLNVFDNLAYGLKIRKNKRNFIAQKVDKMALKLGLSEHLDKKPHQLSSGQKQRVSFGRALIINPKIMLLDEPFGSLDAQTRSEMQQLFKSIRQEFRITSLFVTHDLKEALLMGDQIAKMENGKLKKFNSVEKFIEDPESGAMAEIKFWNQFIKTETAHNDH